MEFVEGASLAELLRAKQREGGGPAMTPDEGAYVGVEICRALDYAHRRMKVVHRDVTPRNVMLDEEGQVKVIDFGIAAPVAVGGHEVFGSPGHMPPEQIEGKELTPATDVFAVAVLLLELWSGKPPFRRKDAKESEAAMRAPHPKPSEIDPRLLPLDDAIARALALDPRERPQEADELGRALRKFLAGVDLHDVARALGDRVRELRVKPPPPETVRPKGLQRPPSRPSAAEIGTKTFAARDEVIAVAAGAPSGGMPYTRKVVSEKPPPRADQIETIATRPIETDGRRSEARASRRRAGLVTLAVVALGVSAAGYAVFKSNQATPTVATTTTTSTMTTTSTTTSTSPSDSTSSSTSPSSSIPPSTSTSTHVAADASVAPVEKATLVLAGDPGATATVDGAPAPLGSRQVTAGTHFIGFFFQPTQETVGPQAVTFAPNGRVVVTGHFTGVKPGMTISH
jgi:serine/threonine-protein kinase